MKTLPLFGYDVGTVALWRSVAPSYGVRSWRSAMLRFADQHGRAVAHLGNDGAEILERAADGLLQRTALPPQTVRWAR